jgi:hypothetical protein
VSVLGPPEFSTAAQVRFSVGARNDVEHAKSRGLDPVEVVSEQLAKYVWPEHLAANLSHDYPEEKASIDQWVRAGFCHGTLDVLRGRGPRSPTPGLVDERARGYVSGYLNGRYGMTPS